MPEQNVLPPPPLTNAPRQPTSSPTFQPLPTYGGMGEGVIQERLWLLRVTRSGDFAQKNDLEISSFLRKARETKFSALSEFTVFFVQNLRYQGKFET